MSAWDGAILAFVGMLGGALLVVLFQLVGTLRATRALLEDLGPELKKTVRETATVAQNLAQLSGPISEQGEGVARFLSALDRLAGTVDKLNRVAQTAGMVAAAAAPAVTAAIQAVRRAQAGPVSETEADPEPANAEPPRPETDGERGGKE